MKAIVYERYGPPEVFRLTEVDKPAPKADQVLVKLRAVSVNAPDWRLMRATPFFARLFSGLLRPKHRTLGSDVAGTVEAVGPGARQFKVGEDVFGDLATFGFGGFAEYACPTEKALARKPPRVSFEVAAASPMAALTALQALRDHARVESGKKVLIVGASGGVGTFAIQIAKLLGGEVTAVCSTGKVDTARDLGADRYLMAGGDWPQIRQALLRGPLLSLFAAQKLRSVAMKATQKDLGFLAELLEAGKVKPVIERRFPLESVPDAIRYVEQGHALGKVIINVDPSTSAQN